MEGFCPISRFDHPRNGECVSCWDQNRFRKGVMLGRIDRVICPICKRRLEFPTRRLLPIQEFLIDTIYQWRPRKVHYTSWPIWG
jgi:hypothetical protein